MASNQTHMTYYAPLIAALATLLITSILLSSRIGRKIQDVPNERSLHVRPVPRVGGAALVVGMLLGWSLMFNALVWWVVFPLLFLFIVSLLDDMRGLPVRLRLVAHIVAAATLVMGAGLASRNLLLALAVMLAVVWMINLYNFMDGSDGLAGGMAVSGFAMYGAAAFMHGDETQAMLNFSIGTAALGFLFFNFNPARIFLGDAGSIPLGFLVGAMGLWGWQQELWPAWFPLLVFSPFIMDATVTLLKRAMRGAKITEAHREHYYQRLVQIGWGHRNVALFAYALMLAAGASALLAMQYSAAPWFVFVAWGLVYALLMRILDRRWQAFRREQHDQA